MLWLIIKDILKALDTYSPDSAKVLSSIAIDIWQLLINFVEFKFYFTVECTGELFHFAHKQFFFRRPSRQKNLRYLIFVSSKIRKNFAIKTRIGSFSNCLLWANCFENFFVTALNSLKLMEFLKHARHCKVGEIFVVYIDSAPTEHF